MNTGRRIADWENWVGRHLRLRDLHVFATVTTEGSMARAAQRLGITQPAVSKVVADLEYTLKVRLLDRSRRGVEPAMYGRTLLRRGNAAFDELKQSVMDIDFLSDRQAGNCASAVRKPSRSLICRGCCSIFPGVIRACRSP